MNSERVLSLIFQYLNDNNYLNALRELENESGVSYSEIEHPSKGNELCCIIDEYENIQNSMKGLEVEDIDDKSLDQELAIQEYGETANKLKREYFSLHEKGVLTVRFAPKYNNNIGHDDQVIFASTSADKSIKIWDITKCLNNLNDDKEDSLIAPSLLCYPDLTNRTPFLCLEFHPSIPGMIAAGSMDGGVVVISEVDKNINGKIEFNSIVHSKYVVRVKWGDDFLVSASYDKSLCLFSMKEEGGKYLFEEKKRWSFSGYVEAIELTNDKETLIVSVRGDNYLNYISLLSYDIIRINMNSLGDDHVSFTAMHLSCSPSGKQLLVQTDRDRIIVMRTHSSIQLRNLYGANNNTLSQPRALWHPSGKFIYGTSQTNQILKWDVVTQNVEGRLSGFGSYPRDLDYHPTRELLITGSYDKSIRIWGI